MFKLVFGSVTLFPQDNELMLKVSTQQWWGNMGSRYIPRPSLIFMTLSTTQWNWLTLLKSLVTIFCCCGLCSDPLEEVWWDCTTTHRDIDYWCIVIQVAMNCSIKSFFLSSPVCCKVRLLLFWLLLLYYVIAGLNRLQSASHKQYMKDLFVELCLTVPVRLRYVDMLI